MVADRFKGLRVARSNVAGTLTRRDMTCGLSLLVRGLCGVFGPPPRAIWRATEPAVAHDFRRLGTFAEMVLAVAHENEEIVPASVSAILYGNVEHPWENSSQHERPNA